MFMHQMKEAQLHTEFFANISRTVVVMLRESVLPAYEQALQMHKQNYEINI